MKIAYCTIASANYLSRVQTLEKSLHLFHPDADFIVLLCEYPDVCRQVSAETNFQFLSPSDVGCPQWHSMAFYYDITEFNTALKPFLLENLLKDGYQAVIYLDPDIEIYSPLDELSRLLQEYEVLLTPHVCHPVPEDGKSPTMESYLRAGQFNLGFIAVSDSKAVRQILTWWQGVLLEKCLFDANSRFFVDQFWAAAIPSFLDKVFILRDPAYNMAYWNIFQRKLEMVNGKWLADGRELKFFHFSGLTPNDLTKVSIHQNRITASVGSPLHKLLSEYFEKIRHQEWAIFSDRLYSFAKYTNGEPITIDERRTYLSMNMKEREAIGDPFADNSSLKNVIRLQCQIDIDQGKGFAANKAEILNRKVEVLEKKNELLLNSLSWRVTAPLRKLHSFLTGKD